MRSTSDKNTRTRPLLVGFGGSTTAHHAARWAAEEAARRHRPLVLARIYSRPHVAPLDWTPVGLPENMTRSLHAMIALDELERECRRAFPDVPVTARLSEGDAAARLNALANELDAELVVLGHPQSRAMSRISLGTTADHLLKTITHPIVTVPNNQEPPTEQAPVLVGVDDDEEADREVIEFAFNFAARHGCPVHALHGQARTPEAAQRHCERALAPARARHDTVPVRIDVVPEARAEALITRAAGARLLVVGNHHHNAVHRAVHGSVCHTALHRANCPVAIIPTQR